MKKTDIAMIILIASIGVTAAYLISMNLSFLKVPEGGVTVQTIDEISSDLVPPEPKVFNKEAINPTVEIVVGSDSAK